MFHDYNTKGSYINCNRAIPHLLHWKVSEPVLEVEGVVARADHVVLLVDGGAVWREELWLYCGVLGDESGDAAVDDVGQGAADGVADNEHDPGIVKTCIESQSKSK